MSGSRGSKWEKAKENSKDVLRRKGNKDELDNKEREKYLESKVS